MCLGNSVVPTCVESLGPSQSKKPAGCGYRIVRRKHGGLVGEVFRRPSQYISVVEVDGLTTAESRVVLARTNPLI